MRIEYIFADGTRSALEVDEAIGAFIAESRRLEENLARKERCHCCSYDAIVYEGMEYADEETPERILEQEECSGYIAAALAGLTTVQRRRLLMLADGLSMRAIAVMEGVGHKSVCESISGARKKFLKCFQKDLPISAQ